MIAPKCNRCGKHMFKQELDSGLKVYVCPCNAPSLQSLEEKIYEAYLGFQIDCDTHLKEQAPEMAKLFAEGDSTAITKRGERIVMEGRSGILFVWDSKIVMGGIFYPNKLSWKILHLDIEDTEENRVEAFELI